MTDVTLTFWQYLFVMVSCFGLGASCVGMVVFGLRERAGK